ncbi:MAG: hypothetical protein M5T61_19200 [Acidimicrobiia bacterium]|nr:hypothetical protein [Acidimicrobiia bacterium]
MEHPVVRLASSMCVDGGGEAAWPVGVLQQPDEGGLLVGRCGHVSEDVGGGFDERLFHHAVTEVG